MYISEQSELEGLDGFSLKKALKKVEKAVRRDPVLKLVKKVDPVGKLLIKTVASAPARLKKFDKQVKNEIGRSKYAQYALYGAGAIAAPFTGGWSMAAASAAVQSSKAAKSGKSFGAQLAQGLGAGAVGWVAGQGLVYGAGKLGVGAGAAQAAGGAASTAATTAGTAASTAGKAASAGGWLKTAAAGLNTAKDVFGVAALVRGLTAKAPGAMEAPPMGIEPQGAYVPGGGWDAGGGGSGGGGGGGGASDQGNSFADEVAQFSQSNAPLYIAGAIAALTVVSIAVKKGKRK